jgi:Flp pilus assembly protein TadB
MGIGDNDGDGDEETPRHLYRGNPREHGRRGSHYGRLRCRAFGAPVLMVMVMVMMMMITLMMVMVMVIVMVMVTTLVTGGCAVERLARLSGDKMRFESELV